MYESLMFMLIWYFASSTIFQMIQKKRVSHRLQDILWCNRSIYADHCRLDNTDRKGSGTNQ